ncbi:MAG: FHA domain-containing protein [Thermoanaerobaculia bacterium]
MPVDRRERPLIIQCSSCKTRYHYDESRFAGIAVKKIRCTKCAFIFEIENPAIPVAPAGFQPEETGPLNSPILGSDDFSLDTTVMGGGPRKRPIIPPPLPVGRIAAAPASVPAVAAMRVNPRLHSTDEFPLPAGVGRVTQTGADQRLRLPMGYRLSLACISGPDSGRIFEIDRPRVILGRASGDITLSDSQCSRQHAAIEVMDDEVMLVDLGSTNGTYVEEKRVSRAPLENRTEFDVGASTLMFLRTRQE